MFTPKYNIILNTNNSNQSVFLAMVPISFIYSFIHASNKQFLAIALYQPVVTFPSEKSLLSSREPDI